MTTAEASLPTRSVARASTSLDHALLWAIRIGLLTLLVTPLIVSPSTIFPFVVGKAIFSRTVIEIVLAIWLILLVRRPEYRPAPSFLGLLFGLFLLATLISGIFGVSFQRSIWGNFERMTGVFDLAHWFAALIIMMTVIKGLTQWRIYLSALMGMGIFLGILGIFEANQATWSAFSWLQGQQVGRLNISLGNSTYVGAIGMVTTLIALGLFADALWKPRVDNGEEGPHTGRAGGRRRRIRQSSETAAGLSLALGAFYLSAAAAGAFMLFGSGSRGAFFGLTAALLFSGAAYSVLGAVRWLRYVAAGATALLIVTFIVFLTLDGTRIGKLRGVAPIFDRTISAADGGRELSSYSRSVGTQSALDGFLDRPITGWGYENFATIWNRKMDRGAFSAPFEEFDVAHNRPVEILSTTGLLGFAPYAAFWIWAVWLGIRRIRRKSESQFIDLAITAAVLAFLAHLIFLFNTASTTLLMMIMMAYIASGELRVGARAGRHLPDDLLAPRGAVAVREEPRRETRSSRRRRQSEGSRPASPGESWGEVWVRFLAPTVIVTVLILSLIFTQLQPWRAARAAIRPGTPEEIVSNQGIFTQLGTITRAQFVDAVSRQLTNVPNENQRNQIFNLAEAEGLTAIRDEPENMKVRIVMANFYRESSKLLPSRRDELVRKAREQSDEAIKLGPHVFEALRDQVQQAFKEDSLPAIEAAVAAWHEAEFRPGLGDQYDESLGDARERLSQK